MASDFMRCENLFSRRFSLFSFFQTVSRIGTGGQVGTSRLNPGRPEVREVVISTKFPLKPCRLA